MFTTLITELQNLYINHKLTYFVKHVLFAITLFCDMPVISVDFLRSKTFNCILQFKANYTSICFTI